MALPLEPVSITAPGKYGLNLQEANTDLPSEWATIATNCIIDNNGRIASRKGRANVTSSPLSGTPNVQQIFEYLKTAGTSEIISAANNNIYTGTTTLSSIYSSGVTANNWKFVNFNGYLWAFQAGHAPLRYDGATMVTIASLGGAGVAPQANEVLAAYGRLWTIDESTDKTILRYSDTLIGQNWSGGSSGSVDLKSVWTNGMDSGLALAAFNGFLVIFGRRSILIYQNPSNPATMSLVEHIKGIGCVARDSVQDIGTDILFLSETGIRSLGRTIQEKSMPARDLSKNVRDDLLSTLASDSEILIRSTYHEPEGFYLLNFPTIGLTYCLDLRHQNPDGTNPVTKWTGINPKALFSAKNRILYIGHAGVIAKYYGYMDNISIYQLAFSTSWLDFKEPFTYKILKKILTTVIGANGATFTVRWTYDYMDQYFSIDQTIQSLLAEYGVAEYGIGEYTDGILITRLGAPAKSKGKVVKISIFATINGSKLGVQKIEAYAKRGREI